MEGSDTKLMPCHTGCQQISQWITPQPLDVHGAEGHKHERRRGRPSVRLAVIGLVPASRQLIEDKLKKRVGIAKVKTRKKIRGRCKAMAMRRGRRGCKAEEQKVAGSRKCAAGRRETK